MSEQAASPGPWVRLDRWCAPVDPANEDDPFADLKADVAAFSPLDPLQTLTGLSQASGVPVGALGRYVLAKWATGGNEALLELGTNGVEQLQRAIDDAEAAGTDQARLAAYDAIKQMVAWLRAGA